MYEFLLQLLRASLPEFLGNLMAATALAAGGWGVKKAGNRIRVRRTRNDALPLTGPYEEADRPHA